MNNITVIPRLMIGDDRFFFDYNYLEILILSFKLERCGKPNGATAHNNDIVLHRFFFRETND